MVGQPSPEDTDLAEWVDQVADRFDAAWRQGRAPPLADFLDGAAEKRPALLRELVKIDLEYRCRAGERPAVEDYSRAFPELLQEDGSLPDDLVLYARRVYQQFGGAGGVPEAGTAPSGGPAAGTVEVRCPHCGNPVAVGGAGPRPLTCPGCGSSFRVEAGPLPSAPAAGPPRVVGRFQLLQLLGEGAFGAVYKARDAELDRLVAVKLPRAGAFADAEDRERFLREARSAALLRHPHIVPVHEIAHEGGMPYLVSDYVEGSTLAERLAARRPGFREAAALVAAVAEALDYAHRRGVVHRDVNPRNVLIDADGRPHVTDFGLAHRDEGATVVTLDGRIVGTPAYMAPEQAAGELSRVDGRSDVYGLGVILYELLTGERPFRGNTRMLLRQVLHDEPRPPRRLNDHIPRDLETVCLKALAKAPARRYPTAGDLAADLRRWLKGEPIRARPVGPLGRLGRWCRRNPRVAGLTAALAATLLAGTGISLHFAVQARQRAEETRRHLYAANLALARRYWEDNQVRPVLGLLERTRPGPGERDLRGWEWYFQDRLCHGELRTLHLPAGVQGMAFRPDGRWLAATGGDGSVRLWDVATGRELRRWSGCPSGEWGRGLAFSPDGCRLVAADGHGQVKVWDAAGGRLRCAFPTHAGLHGIAVGPGGRRLAAAYGDGTVRLWDVAGGRELRCFRGHTGPVAAVAFRPDGRRLASCSRDRTVRLWDAATGRQVAEFTGHTRDVTDVAFSPDGARLASAGVDGTVRLWDAAAGRPLATWKADPRGVNGVAFSPDGRWLTGGSNDGAVRAWEVAGGPEPRIFRGHTTGVTHVAFSPDGTRLASGGSEVIKVWDAGADPEASALPRQADTVMAVAFSPDGTRLATAGGDRAVRLWDVASGREVRALRGHTGGVWRLAFRPDGRLLASAGHDGTVRLWDVTRGKEVRTLTGHGAIVFGVAFRPDGRRLASASKDGTVKVWDVATGRERRTLAGHFAGGKPSPVHGVAYSPDGKLLASCADDRTVKVWDAADGRELRTLTGHTAYVYDVAFSPDGRLLASAGHYGTVRVWDAATGRERHTLTGHAMHVWSVAFSPDGRRLASAGGDKAVKLWDTTDFRELYSLRAGAYNPGVAFSPDGHRLASCTDDRRVKVWDARPLTDELRTEREALGLVASLFATPLPREEVLARVRAHPAIGEAVRRRAEAFAAGWREEVSFREAAWRVVRRPGAAAGPYRQALRWAEAAGRLRPGCGPCLTTLGAARYRVGLYREALATLSRAEGRNGDCPVIDRLFRAMALHRLGRQGQARKVLAEVRRAIDHEPSWNEDDEAWAFLREAEGVLRGPPGAAEAPRRQ